MGAWVSMHTTASNISWLGLMNMPWNGPFVVFSLVARITKPQAFLPPVTIKKQLLWITWNFPCFKVPSALIMTVNKTYHIMNLFQLWLPHDSNVLVMNMTALCFGDGGSLHFVSHSNSKPD